VSVSLPIWLRRDSALGWYLPLAMLATCSAASCYELGNARARVCVYVCVYVSVCVCVCVCFRTSGDVLNRQGGKPFETSILREAKQNTVDVRLCFERCDLFCFLLLCLLLMQFNCVAVVIGTLPVNSNNRPPSKHTSLRYLQQWHFRPVYCLLPKIRKLTACWSVIFPCASVRLQ
jgi:hypothetical protein